MEQCVSRPAIAVERPLGIRVLAYAGGLWKSWRNRRNVQRLLEADDRMLADIGLSRSDVVGALSSPLHDDPSLLLVRARNDRRRARTRTF